MSLRESIRDLAIDIATPGILAGIEVQDRIHKHKESKKSEERKEFEKNIKEELNKIKED